MIDKAKIEEFDSHWMDVMELARKNGFIRFAAGGVALLETHENQLKEDGEEKYIREQKGKNGIDVTLPDKEEP